MRECSTAESILQIIVRVFI